MAITLRVNGSEHALEIAGDTPLLYALRNDLALNGAKYGCGAAQCGACMVLVDGQPVPSCVTPVETVAGAEIVTLEGLGSEDAPHPLQAAFIALQAAQCGYCVGGIIVSAAALLERNRDPSDVEIREALAGNLCRCGTHARMLEAVRRAAEEMA